MGKHLGLRTIRMPNRREKLRILLVSANLFDAGSTGVRDAAKRCTRDTLPRTVRAMCGDETTCCTAPGAE